MKTRVLYILSAFLFMYLPLLGNIKVVPTFESCSVYVPCDLGKECRLFFKKQSESVWKQAYTPFYDAENHEFRGSIVKLSEDTEYDVKAELWNEGTLETQSSASFITWKSNVNIAQTINISNYKSGNHYRINNLVGTSDGWIKIVASEEIGLENTISDYAIYIPNSQYVILEGITLKGGGKHGIYIPASSSNIRIVNCDISRWGRTPATQNECGEYLDNSGVRINNDAGIKIEGAGNIVVERCYIHDTRGKTNPWAGVVEMGPFAGNTYEFVHPGGPNAIHVRQSAGGIVIRNNDLIGNQLHRFNDVIETAKNLAADGGFNKDSDIYGNMMAFCQDDAIELDGGQCNVRMYNNRMEQAYDGISTAPNMKGPSYIFNNVMFNLGNSNGVESCGVKNGGGIVNTKGRQYLFHNTFITVKNTINGVGAGSGAQREMYMMTTRNNIFVSQSKIAAGSPRGSGMSISDMQKSAHNDFDYDLLGNTMAADGKGGILAVVGSELHGVFALPRFTDMNNGVFTLENNDPGIGKGLLLPNFSDEGLTAADMGIFGYGKTSSLIPIRPLNITADKYHIKMVAGQTITITLTIGQLKQDTDIAICKSEDMDWLTIVPQTTHITSHSTLQLTLKAITANYRQLGVVLIRLKDGLSVPISIEI